MTEEEFEKKMKEFNKLKEELKKETEIREEIDYLKTLIEGFENDSKEWAIRFLRNIFINVREKTEFTEEEWKKISEFFVNFFKEKIKKLEEEK